MGRVFNNAALASVEPPTWFEHPFTAAVTVTVFNDSVYARFLLEPFNAAGSLNLRTGSAQEQSDAQLLVPGVWSYDSVADFDGRRICGVRVWKLSSTSAARASYFA